MQQVLHYSALKTGVAYIALTLDDHRLLRRRAGARRPASASAACCRPGSLLSAAALVLFAQLPVTALLQRPLPGFLLSGIGLALSFVPMSIAALTGVRQSDAGVASGLINTSQQIGGAIGLAVATTIAATFTTRYVDSHPGAAGSAARR